MSSLKDFLQIKDVRPKMYDNLENCQRKSLLTITKEFMSFVSFSFATFHTSPLLSLVTIAVSFSTVDNEHRPIGLPSLLCTNTIESIV